MSEKTNKTEDGKASSRRDFFKLASVGAAGAAATALAGTSQAGAAEAKPEHGGYQLTDHVKKAYAASRF